VTIFFYNPNITDEAEYRRRLESQRRFVELYNRSMAGIGRIVLATGSYEPSLFFQKVKGLEHLPEGGERCERCFELRIERSAAYAAMCGIRDFTTTLSVSPYKHYGRIARIGAEVALRYGLNFLGDDFKKRDGYARSVALSRLYGLYRQTYCGCKFSKPVPPDDVASNPTPSNDLKQEVISSGTAIPKSASSPDTGLRPRLPDDTEDDR
jgi:predicted adenine nucleotide alpha hydrolase (AANH) superfamily ATPase